MMDRRRSRAPFDDLRDVTTAVIGYYFAGICVIAGIWTIGLVLWGMV